MKKKKYLFTFLLLILTCIAAHTQNTAWLIPRIVYVGDSATLIIPLPPAAQDLGDIILTSQSPNFPTDINIDFHRIVLERRIAGSRLLIEFTAFVPGLLELPIIEIGGERFSGLNVTINSIIDSRAAPQLSGPASSLAMPGTALMLYGTMIVFVLLFLLILWFILKGRRFMRGWLKKWKRWRLFVSMKNTEKRLNKALSKGADKREILDKLSEQFRNFLSFFTENNCRAMTAREFESLPELFPDTASFNKEFDASAFLGNFFHRCDELRFSGEDISSQDTFKLLDDLRNFLKMIHTKTREGRAE